MYTELGSLYPPAKSSRQGSTHRQEPVHPLCVPKIPCQSTLEYSFPAVLVLGDRQDGSMAALNFEIYLASPTDSATAADKQSTSTSADCLSTLVSHRRCRSGSVHCARASTVGEWVIQQHTGSLQVAATARAHATTSQTSNFTNGRRLCRPRQFAIGGQCRSQWITQRAHTWQCHHGVGALCA
eukprot:TRINITY_DN6609_c0_g1_i5.p1 TRINITY_DN6609_c0_g1~~TRINITY_DN6609_c0_g1_i5.p1  ORF type:complete len:183 (+),score=16.13 TRINITY_DN6609_c0_g1_i5:501-1049(+)